MKNRISGLPMEMGTPLQQTALVALLPAVN
jgi:hypothetical protein